MIRTKLLPFAVSILLAGLLAGCTSFAPVYGDRSGGGMDAVRFNFAAPDSRIEQIIFDRLKLAFPGEAGPDDPVIDIAASTGAPAGSKSDAFEVARPLNVRVQATVTITQNDRVLFEATRFADTAYQSGKLAPVNIASSQGVQEAAARSAAESLRLSILAGYHKTSWPVPDIIRP